MAHLATLAMLLAALPAHAQVVDEVDAVGCGYGECDHQPEEQPKPAEPAKPPVIVEAKEDADCQRRYPKPVTSEGAPLTGHIEVEYVVHSDGSVHEVKQRGEGPALLFQSVQAWLTTCRFIAATADGKAVAMGMKQAFSFRTQEQKRAEAAPSQSDLRPKARQLDAALPKDPEGPPRPLGSDLRFPKPLATCQPRAPKPVDGAAGLVLAEFVIHTDGHVGEFVSRSPKAPAALVEAVRSWLYACPYEPARQKDGKPVPVKIIQPFTFKSH